MRFSNNSCTLRYNIYSRSMTDYQLASSLLAYINNPNGISDGLNYVEDCEDVEAYKRVFKMIFDALDQSQHYKMMTGKQLKS